MKFEHKLVAIAGLFALCACGSNSRTKPRPDASTKAIPNGPAGVEDASAAGAIPNAVDAGRVFNRDAGAVRDAAAACASVRADAEVEPVYLAFAFDVSGSMGKGDKKWHDKSLKWDPVVAALKAFFGDSASAGLNAALTFFPADGGESARCKEASYETPDVPMTALPSQDFAAAIDAIEPKSSSDWRGGTPTLFVMQGTRAFVKTEQAQHPGRYVIVLVTDGYPEGCSSADDKISAVADEVAAALSDTVSTYVIGVANPPISGAPDTVSDLQSLAKAGGTQAAFLIDTGDPAKTVSAFQSAVDQIRGTAISCNLDIPAPPDGRSFDKQRVKVSSTSGGSTGELRYDADCTDASGWHYDDPKDPKQIVLCDDACHAVQADASSALRVEFACEQVIMVE